MNFVAKLFHKLVARFSNHLERRLFMQPRFGKIFGERFLTSFDVRKFAQVQAALEAGDFFNRHLYNREYYNHYGQHLLAMTARAAALGDGAFLEFGVATGTSIRIIAQGAGARRVTGFDSFQGLPEDWTGGVRRGAFAGKIPELPERIALKIGLIADTLPAFLATFPERRIAFIHIDTDLYSTARLILSLCQPYLYRTVIVFDEFLNYPGWRDHEYKAFAEFQEENAGVLDFTYLGMGGNTAVSVLASRKAP